MIDRTIEETLLLSGVQIDRHNAVCTGGVEQIEIRRAVMGSRPRCFLSWRE